MQGLGGMHVLHWIKKKKKKKKKAVKTDTKYLLKNGCNWQYWKIQFRYEMKAHSPAILDSFSKNHLGYNIHNLVIFQTSINFVLSF